MTYICILVIAHVIVFFCCMVHISLKITGPSNLEQRVWKDMRMYAK